MMKKRKRAARLATSNCHLGTGSPALPPEWMGMGKRAGLSYPGAERLPPPLAAPHLLLLLLLLAIWGDTAYCQQQTQCRIQKCTTDFVSLTSHLNTGSDGFDSEFCKALRAYAACTQRTSKACRGNLVYHSAVLGISDLMSQRNCSKDGPTSSTNPEFTIDACNYHSRATERILRSGDHTQPNYLFCGLFGDPHLRTFQDHFQTCKVEGAWPLIDNNYLSVQVTNVPVVPGSSATATNKITIIFKAFQDCTDQKVYQAVTDDLPAAFVDGSTSGGDSESKTLRIIERVGGKHVEMHARYIGTTVIVRQLGNYLTLAVRMPEELAMAYEESQDLQLCVNGCPTSERIDEGGHLRLPITASNTRDHTTAQASSVYTLESAIEKCLEKIQVKHIYFHSCVFDLLTTGDANFTAAAFSAWEDVETLHPRKERWQIFPNKSSCGTTHALPALVFWLAGLLLLFL
ncbi:RGM domain family member B [Xenopus laevis]|uniref:RGM domain family member B n=2 Tax=Xenopus laevis TaxID=8355 RepID=A0A8J0VJ51_XENLA|nr:RGM domain family member B [Xenopus laevis]